MRLDNNTSNISNSTEINQSSTNKVHDAKSNIIEIMSSQFKEDMATLKEQSKASIAKLAEAMGIPSPKIFKNALAVALSKVGFNKTDKTDSTFEKKLGEVNKTLGLGLNENEIKEISSKVQELVKKNKSEWAKSKGDVIIKEGNDGKIKVLLKGIKGKGREGHYAMDFDSGKCSFTSSEE